MNWGAAVLLLVGGAIVVIGVTGSQQSVCQAISGSDCSWLPTPSPSCPNPPCSTPPPPGSALGPEPASATSIDNIIANCQKNVNCTRYMQLASSDASNFGVDQNEFVRQIAAESSFNPTSIAGAPPAGFGVSKTDVAGNLSTAARLMSNFEAYWNAQVIGNDPKDVLDLSLASYHYGLGNTQGLFNKFGSNWLTNAPVGEQNYVSGIDWPLAGSMPSIPLGCNSGSKLPSGCKCVNGQIQCS